MLPLIVGREEKEKIAELRAIAAAFPFDPVKAQAQADENPAAFRDMIRMMSIRLGGFYVVYTHEIQPNAPPPGRYHHISISVNRAGMMPSDRAVEMILPEFEMAPLHQSAAVWIEDVDEATSAINVLQLHGVAA